MNNFIKRGYIWWLLILVCDQISKYIILHQLMQPPQTIPVTGFFNLVLVWNHGTSFSLIRGGHDVVPYALAALALGICIWLHRWLRRTTDHWHASALGLVLGGAIGNVIDRLLYGAVIDFLDLHYAGWHWPAFNVADSAIVIGVFMLLIGEWKKKS